MSEAELHMLRPVSTAASATRPHAASCGAACRSASSGARPTARFCFIPTRPSSPRSAPSSRASPRPARPAACGCGSAIKACKLPLQMQRARRDPLGRGELPRHPPGTDAIPSMRAPTSMARRAREMTLDAAGVRQKRIRQLPRDQWQVLIKEHHPGYIDWQTYEANQQRIAKNTRPGPHKAGGAVREGSALLQGLASCGHCGRRLRTHYTRPQLDARLSLLRRASRRGARQLLPQHRRRADRRGRGARIHCSARAGEARCHAGRCRAARDATARPRSSTGGSASSERATRQAAPSAAIAPSIPTTGSSPVASSVHGRRASTRSRRKGGACAPRA